MTNFKEEVNVDNDNELKTCCDCKPADVPYEQYSQLEYENLLLKETIVRQANEITDLKGKLYWERKKK